MKYPHFLSCDGNSRSGGRNEPPSVRGLEYLNFVAVHDSKGLKFADDLPQLLPAFRFAFHFHSFDQPPRVTSGALPCSFQRRLGACCFQSEREATKRTMSKGE